MPTALGVLLLAGIGLRVALMLSRDPAFLGYPDSARYIMAARGALFGPPMWPVGYQTLLRVLHELHASMSFAMLVQHALGVATALLLFLTVRRVAPAAWGLLPAAVVLLAGPQLFLEHSPLSDVPFGFLVAAAAYCTVRALGEPGPGWAVAASGLGVAAACVRSVGLLLPALSAVWLVAATPGGARRRLVAGGAVVLTAWLLLAAYVTVAKHEAGYVDSGLARSGGWALYARVAPFADCDRFTPPARARVLCERRPASERPAPFFYVLGRSPAARALGSRDTTRPADDKALSGFARQAILHQPIDYLRAIGSDLESYWSPPDFVRGRDLGGADYDALASSLVKPLPVNVDYVREWYATGDPPVAAGVPVFLRGFERHTRLEGPAFLLLVLVALVGVPLARGSRLAIGLYLIGVSAVMLIAPVATYSFDARYAIPGYGPLAAAGAIGAATLWERVRARQGHGRRIGPPAVHGGDSL